jgi:hypothetical protein
MRRPPTTNLTDEERLAYHDHDEARRVGEYVLSQLRKPNERVRHAELIATRHVHGDRYAIWDVHTARSGRWWVVDPLMNLYPQKSHLSMDATFSLHLGVMERMLSQERPAAPKIDRMLVAWRKWQSAAETLTDAEEREALQSVGLRLRESLIALGRAAATVVSHSGEDRPKGGDFIGWSALAAEVVAAGPSRARLPSHLKDCAASTWHLVSWLTHAQGADLGDAEVALWSTRHVISIYSESILRFEVPIPDECPRCGSLRLVATELQGTASALCESCGWMSEPEQT